MGVKASDADFLREARKRFQAGIDADFDNRERDRQDRAFYRGDQWEPAALEKRKNRPTLTVNRLPQFVKQVTGEMRQNKPAIKVLPVDDQTDPKLAEVYSAIIRHIESGSDAHRIYSKAAEQAVIGGIGWFRILTDYTDQQSFDQDICVKPIRNPLSVVWDPDARELTKQDMNWAFVTEMVSKDKFEAEHPNLSLSGWDSDDAHEWVTGDAVRVAEYWRREPVKRTLARLPDGSTRFVEGDELKLLKEGNAEIEAMGGDPIPTREVDGWKVKWCRMTGNAVIDKGEWKGQWIPLVPVIGEEVEVGDVVMRHGLCHHSKDAQRSYNYARSAMVEHVGSQPKAPFLATVKQLEGHASAWHNLNEGNPAVLPYNPDPQAPGAPQRQMPPTTPTAWYQEAQVADQDMKATTGIYDASLGGKSNETSGRAIIAREQQGDIATFVYIDNLSAAIRQAGAILLDLIPHIYTDERVIRIVGEDGAIEEYAKINSRLPDGTVFNDVSVGKFDIEVTTGPAYATKRQEAADKMMQLVQAFPQLAAIGGDMIIKALDMPYGDKLAERVQLALLPPGIDQEADKKRMEQQQKMAEAMGPQQPDPMQEMQMRGMTAEVEGKEADATLKKVQVSQATGEIQQLIESLVATRMGELAGELGIQ